MLTLVRPFGFLDGGLLNNRKECTCSPHSRATEDYNKNGNVYKYCSQIHVTLNCLNNLGNNKNCSLNLATSTLQTGTVWQFKYYNCTEILKRKPSDFKSTVSSKDTRHGKDGDKNNIPGPKRDDKCVYRRKFVDTVHCGLFGDPHLKTFSNRRQTCVVKGAWPMLNNRYLAVQVTNVLIERNNPVATATSKITVLIKKSKHGCTEQKVYQAHVGHVPTTFKDGTRETGPNWCKTRLEKEPDGEGVRLYICYLNTTVLIRKVGKYLTLNIRTPENYVALSQGLCVTGCPRSEMIDYEGFFREHQNSVLFGSTSPAMLKDNAVHLCKVANVTDFYYDSCVFDLISTGDRMFSGAAYRAMQDAVHMDPKLRLRRSNSVVLKYMDKASSDANAKQLSIPSDASPLSRTFLPHFLLLIAFYSVWR